MDADIFRDLKQLDERLQTAKQLLDSCADLFEKSYEKTVEGKLAFWPYAIEGETAEKKWPDYEENFPETPKLSPSTTSICGWAVLPLSRLSKDSEKRLGTCATEAAIELGKLPPERLKSKTFQELGEIFLHAQVLRFLASQAQYNGKLFRFVFQKVRDTLKNPPETLHAFLLHYCVLAWEEVRGPAVELADSVLQICDIADDALKLKSSKADSLIRSIESLKLAGQLRDALDLFATVVGRTLRQSQTKEDLEKLALETKKVLIQSRDAIKQDHDDAIRRALSSLQQVIDRSLRTAGLVLQALPKEIRPTAPPQSSTASGKLRALADYIKVQPKEPWYNKTFRERLVNKVVRQISYASSNEVSRLDIGALAYSLAAVLHSNTLTLPRTLARKALSIIFEHQRSGVWSEIKPMARTAIGFVHYPLNIEIANAVLSILRDGFYEDPSVSWTHIDEVMDWVVSSTNQVGNYRGWCSDHYYVHDRIDLWATAQVAQFLLEYRDLRSTLVIRSAIDRAGLVTVGPNSVGTSWKKLQPSDLEANLDEQIKNMLRDKFVFPHLRSEKPRSSSVLLYGPPGTSKTSLMEALANKLQWRFLQLTPADFLSTGGDQVEARATLLFEILKRAKELVILFDEVDEFLLDRELEGRPEGIFRFMTTSMLPKLQSLKSQGRVIFGIGTNYKERLDKAITRLGRVDHDWAILPPDFTSRILLIKGLGIEINANESRDLATKTPFFSYKELEKVVLEYKRAPIDPWEVVPHPTASPEAYNARPGFAEEFPILVEAQIVDLKVDLPEETRNKLKGQLKEFETAKKETMERDSIPSSEISRTTFQIVEEAIKKLEGP